MATPKAPLALDYAGHGKALGWRKGEHLIDALPYIDPLAPEVKKQVDQLIEDELRRGGKKPSDFLKDLPAMPTQAFEGHPLLATEYERVKAKKEMPALDATRYMLNPPPQTLRNDIGEWKKALDNAGSQLEHQHLRILNLELMLKYGDKVWRAQTQLDESLVIDVILICLLPHLTGSELGKIEENYYSLVQKNFEIENACSRRKIWSGAATHALAVNARKYIVLLSEQTFKVQATILTC
eukprot:gene14476-20500_t